MGNNNKMNRRIPMLFTIIQVASSPWIAYNVTLADTRINADQYAESYFEVVFIPYFAVFSLCMVSFFRAMYSEPGKVFSLEKGVKSKLTCRHCEVEKIHRSHHCSVCKRCSLRMDHHCIWVNNCIGLRNYKYFFLFITYLVLGGSMHSILFITYALGGGPSYIFTGFLIFLFYLHEFFVCVFTFSTFLLFVYHFNLVYNNVTTLENMGGVRISPMGNTESEYDIGFIPNFLQLFGDDFLWWPLPTSPDNTRYSEGFPTRPK